MPTLPNLNLRILLVDDEPDVCAVLKMMLHYEGHDVETVNGGKEALTLLENSRFDVIITDYTMPGMKGDELAITIKKRWTNQPIIMLTAHAEMLKSSGKLLAGVDHLIGKPFLLEDLRKAITEVLPKM